MFPQAQNSWQSLRIRKMISLLLNTQFTSHLRICKTTLQVFYSLNSFVVIVLLTCVGITAEANSATYFLSPSGLDSKAGTSAAPWQTFAFAIPKLKAGDTLILKDGTYTDSNSGYPSIDCSSSAVQNGTSTSPITIKAENERLAFLNGYGQYGVFRMLNCSNWKIEGLRAKSVDNPNSPRETVFSISNSNNLAFKRLLVSHNNRYGNTQLMSIVNSSGILVEESEFYFFHRHAIALFNTNNSVMRRNYVNSRRYADVPGGYASYTPDRGEAAVTIYPGSNNIVENVISEGNGFAADIQATLEAVNNKFLGVISLNDHYGIVPVARGTGNKMPKDTYIENFVAVNPTYYGVFARGAKNIQVKNASVLGGSSGFVADYQAGAPGDGIYSFFSTNALASNVSTYGFNMVNQNNFSHKFPNSYNPKIDFSPNSNYSNERTDDPKLGTCKVFIPQTSPLNGKGEGGADIGANVLYRYEKGVLTNQPLWNTVSGEFPHGALVPGVNDIAGSSAFDVHKRLNVNVNGCAFTSYSGNSIPDSGGSDTVPPAIPTGLTLTIQ